MAKQRGIHQLIGKYNDTCYFERKGTRGGLLRRINSGMGERVRTGEEYINLRAANTVFGVCSMYAAIIFNFFSNRALFLFKKNRQSQLTKEIYKHRNPYFISNNNLEAGFSVGNGYYLSLLFDSVVRKKFYNVFPGFPREIRAEGPNVGVGITLSSSDLEEYCERNKADGCYIGTVGPCFIYNSVRNSTTDKFPVPEYGYDMPRYGFTWKRGEGDLDITINVGHTDDTVSFGFIYAIPENYISGRLPIRLYNGACCGMFSIFFK